jgi:hypothetical protein
LNNKKSHLNNELLLLLLLFKFKGLRRCLVMWLRVRFTRSHIYQCLVTEKKIIFLGRTHQFSLPCHRFGEAVSWWFSSEQWSMAPLPHCSCEQFFFVLFYFEKPVQLIDFTRTVHVNVNNNFFFKKISLRWIKFTRTVISILFLIIFYLILLHAQKIMKTVVLVEWILYVMKL